MSPTPPTILASPDFADIDRHFASFIATFGNTSPHPSLAALAAAYLSRNIREGHICLDLSTPPRQEVATSPWPTLEEWHAALRQNRAIGTPKDTCPLVLDYPHRLYLRRYWEYEQSLASAILQRCPIHISPNLPSTPTDLQQAAIQAALDHPFLVISGGPGTGKTTTVLKILQRLTELPGNKNLRIAPCAPTGKAAARLQETLAASNLEGRAKVESRISKVNASSDKSAEPPTFDFPDSTLPPPLPGLQPACTLHRLLGYRPNSTEFNHNAKNPLPVDVVVLDEASMVPLTLMAKLFAALPKNARVILLGDRDQLASVEPGAVLGDIAEAANQPNSPLKGHLIQLEKNYRFGNDSAIFALCNTIRQGDADQACALLQKTGEHPLPDLASADSPSLATLTARLRAPVLAGYGPYLRAISSPRDQNDQRDPRDRDTQSPIAPINPRIPSNPTPIHAPIEALKLFAQFRVLSALRSGPYGVENLNRIIESILRSENLITGSPSAYAGMPILITANDYALRLFNGDIGILLPDPVTGNLLAWFSSEDGTPRSVAPTRLPSHEPAFAMTVHKSQGSEFGNVLFVLPDKPSPVLTRELVYTGLTRAKHRVELWSNPTILRSAIGTTLKRDSGLQDRLS